MSEGIPFKEAAFGNEYAPDTEEQRREAEYAINAEPELDSHGAMGECDCRRHLLEKLASLTEENERLRMTQGGMEFTAALSEAEQRAAKYEELIGSWRAWHDNGQPTEVGERLCEVSR